MKEYEEQIAAGEVPKDMPSQTLEQVLSKKTSRSTQESTAADVQTLDEIFGWNLDGEKPVAESSDSKKSTKARNLMSWTLQTYHVVNGRRVSRPQKLAPEDSWEVHYTLTSDKNPTQASYQIYREKRSGVLEQAAATDRSREAFYNMIRRFNKDGKVWRESQDAIDVDQPKVTLYEK